ncbi:MAG: polysaccharide deacetylase family protein [Patescibacteria group bacterium]
MKKIIPRRIFIKKAPLAVLVFAVLGFGLFAYDANKDFISNFQFYHIKSYTTLVSHAVFNENNNNLASALGVLATNNEAGNLNIEQKFAKSVPALLYHSIINEPDGSNILLENFKDQMFSLKKAGWQTVSIEDFYSFMKGEKELPDKSFLLTFDDGAKNSYYPVDPILRALDFRAVMFVITSRTTSPFYLSVRELDKMVKSGRWDLQSHGQDDHDFYPINSTDEKGHFLSNKLWFKDVGRLETSEEFRLRISNDLKESKKWLEERYGKPIVSYAYPFGDYGQNSLNFVEGVIPMIEEVARSIYPISFYQVWEGKGHAFNYPEPTEFMIKRISVKSDWTDVKLLSVLEKGSSKDLPYEDAFSETSGLIKTWGNLNIHNNAIFIGANASTTGSSLFLDGSYLWQNYVFKAGVNLTKGQTFSLTARYKDDKNYVACSFSDKSIRVERFLNGERKVLSELKGNFVFLNKNREVGIGVYDSTVNCYVDGKIAMKGYHLDEHLDQGEIGFKTWDPQINNSELVIKSISVEEIK